MIKKIFPIFGIILTGFFSFDFYISSAQALSFVKGTKFLKAKTKTECEALGGNFMEWQQEIYCTKRENEKTGILKNNTLLNEQNNGNPVTRAEFLEAFLLARKKHWKQDPCQKKFHYSDVDWSDDYGDALQIASCFDIVKGNPDGTFAPNKEISYAAAAKIAIKAFNVPMAVRENVGPEWYSSYVFTIKHIEAIPRKNIQPNDVVTHKEMKYIINTLVSLES